ncbi:hypothetical protein J4217_04120 [Candidatus Pacearchaeota archaeon]|nr:hypothetical protein [Candidatus Pacearchaeota archaeon]
MSLVDKINIEDKLKAIKLKDFRVPLAGVPAFAASIYGGVLAGKMALKYLANADEAANPELIGTCQLVGNYIGGGLIFAPVYIYDCYTRYKGFDASRFFKDQAKLGTVIGLGAILALAKPFVSGQLMRRGMDQGSASMYFDFGAESIRLVANNLAYFNNILNLKLIKNNRLLK